MKALGSWRGLLGVAVLTGTAMILLLVTPVLGSSHEDAIRLHMGTDYQSFDDGTTPQPITVGAKGCALSSATVSGPLVALSSGRGESPGYFDYSLGVKSGGSNGTPCSQVDDSETLVIETVPGQPSWTALRLDVELKSNAWVTVDLFSGAAPAGSFDLVTGASIADYNAANDPDVTPGSSFPYTALSTAADPVAACASPSDSGPDSGPNDNCLWSIEPGTSFDKMVMTTLIGSVSLEGSEDFGNDPDHDTLFFHNGPPVAEDDSFSVDENSGANTFPAPGVLANDTDPDENTLTAVYEPGSGPSDGTLSLNSDGSFTYTPDDNFFGQDSFRYRASDGTDLSDPATVAIEVVEVICPGETVSDQDGVVEGAFTHIGGEASPCKPYDVTASESEGVIDFALDDGPTVPFRGYLEFGAQEAPGGVNGRALQYDPDGEGPAGYQTVLLCLGPTFDGDGNVLAPTSGTILPTGQTWCLATMGSTADEAGLFLNLYQVYGESDPRFAID